MTCRRCGRRTRIESSMKSSENVWTKEVIKKRIVKIRIPWSWTKDWDLKVVHCVICVEQSKESCDVANTSADRKSAADVTLSPSKG